MSRRWASSLIYYTIISFAYLNIYTHILYIDLNICLKLKRHVYLFHNYLGNALYIYVIYIIFLVLLIFGTLYNFGFQKKLFASDRITLISLALIYVSVFRFIRSFKYNYYIRK